MTSSRRNVLLVAVLLLSTALLGFLLLRTTSPSTDSLLQFTAPASDSPGDEGLLRMVPPREQALRVESPRAAEDRPSHPLTLRTVRITGVVLDTRGSPTSLQVAVRGTESFARYSVQTAADADGRFDCSLGLPVACTAVSMDAQGLVRGEPVTCYPTFRSVPPGDVQISCILAARRGARLTGATRAPTADPLTDGVRVLLSQSPIGDPTPLANWNRAGWTMLDEFIAPEPDGTFTAFVRPGGYRIRSVSREGALGEVTSGMAREGETIDVGLLRSAHDAATIRFTVVTSRDDPIPGAWIQLSDRDLYLASAQGHSELPHFVADERGTLLLSDVSLTGTPLVAAVGAPGYEVKDVSIPSGTEAVRVELIETPRLTVRLVGPGAPAVTPKVLAQLQLSVHSVEHGYALVAGGGIPTPREQLEVLSSGSQGLNSGVLDADQRLLWIRRPSPGRYALTLRLGPTSVGTRDFEVGDPMKEPPSIDVSVIGGHPVQVSILLPGQHGEKAARQFLTLRWRSSSDGSISLPFSAASLLEDEMASAALWIPDAFDGIELESRNGCLLPLLACASRISPDASAVLRPAFTEGTSFLHVTVQGDNGTLLSDAWEINVLSLSADCTRWLVALETDSSGSLTVPVRAGTYEVRCSPSFIEPFAKVVVTVGAGERSEVVVPIVR